MKQESSRSRQRLVICLIALLTTSCAEQRAKWALTHADVRAEPPLSQSDLRQIIHVISRATPEEIVMISRSRSKSGPESVTVMTRSVGPATEFILEKAGSFWHITYHERYTSKPAKTLTRRYNLYL